MPNRAFDHILIIMFENQYRGYVMQNPYFRNLAKQGIELTNSFGVMHPSQTNYIASIAGELCNVTDDERPTPALPQQTIVDLIEASTECLDWRAYMDSYIANATPWTSDKFQPQDRYPYMIKHNPFSSFANIIGNQERWQKIDNEAGLFSDILNGTLPSYAWFTPNMWNDGHYLDGTGADSLTGVGGSDLKGNRAPVLVDQQAKWLEGFLGKLGLPGNNSKLPDNTLVVVTFDEADFEAFYETGEKYYYDGPNQIYTVLLGDHLQPGQQHEAYNHYSLLKTVEKNFDLGSLQKNDEHANWFRFLWDERFEWDLPSRLDGKGQADDIKQIASAALDGLLYQFSLSQDGVTALTTLDQYGRCSDTMVPEILSGIIASNIAVAANTQQLILAVTDQQQALLTYSFSLQRGWQQLPLDATGISQLAITEINGANEFMLVTQDTAGNCQSYRLQEQQWQISQAIPVCQNSKNLCLTSMGTTLFLIWQQQESSLFAATYNTATFNQTNVVSSKYACPYDDASINAWSGSAFRLTHYTESYLNTKQNEPKAAESGYAGDGVMQAAVLDGVLHLVHNTCGSQQLVTETFSIPGLLTPAKPVSYDASKQTTTSNGYGTLAQAGWSKPSAIKHVQRDANAALSLCRFGQQLWLTYQHVNAIYKITGEYMTI